VTKVLKPMGITRHTRRMIILFLATIGRPARTSEIRAAVVKVSPEAAQPIYGCLHDLQSDGHVRRITAERDALLTFT
jgi:hypothetical protein